VAHLIQPSTMKQLARPCSPVLPETARYIYLGRVISGEFGQARKGPNRDNSGDFGGVATVSKSQIQEGWNQ
jgi:hypothetical protein